jgi:CheY-like chemotaxis protein
VILVVEDDEANRAFATAVLAGRVALFDRALMAT